MQHPHFHTILQLIETYISDTRKGKRPVINYHTPESMREMFDLSLADTGYENDPLCLIQDITDLSINTQHGRFWNQLYAGPSQRNIIGERLATLLNTSMATYEIAPLFSLMEEELFGYVAELLGRNQHTGYMTPGGTMGITYAMHLARHHLHPQSTHNGNQHRYVIFTSDQAHYAVEKSALLMGLGLSSVCHVQTNDDGSMDTDHLEHCISSRITAGDVPLMINATLGTTVLQGFDDLNTITQIAQQHRIRVHADGCFGGSFLVHDSMGHLFGGIDLVDSFTRNPHKMLGSSQTTSILMTRHPPTASTASSLHVDYLFGQEGHIDRSLDTGNRYIQCGRKADILKLRLQRKMEGTNTLHQYIDDSIHRTQLLTQLIRSSRHLMLVRDPIVTNVCFWFLPPDMDPATTSTKDIIDRHEEIHTIAPRIKKRMLQAGHMMCTYMPLGELPNFWRMITHNIHSTDEDMHFAVRHIEALGLSLYT